jgi:CheY-like chemotaxis protein
MHCTDMLSQALSETRLLLADCRPPVTASDDKDSRANRLDQLVKNMVDTVETIVSCTTHQKRITDDILSLSKLDSNLLEIWPSLWKIDDFLQQIESTFKIEAAQVGVQLEVISDPSLQELEVDWVEADSGRLLQVIVNLVTNAIKFTKDQAGPRIITVCIGASLSLSTGMFMDLIIPRSETAQGEVGSEVSGNEFYLCCSVRDTGCGMDAAGRTRIFSRFSQASPKTYNKYGGSGLGLFISQKLASLQGGQIGYTSEQDAGSTFAVSIKALKAVPVESLPPGAAYTGTTPAKEKGKITQSANSSTQTTDKEKLPSILLVEDNQINQKVLCKQLRLYGYGVYTANNGQDAFDFIKTTKHWKGHSELGNLVPDIDVILMDIEMPIIDGLECAKMIRSAQQSGSITKHLPIIAVTANARPEQLKRAVEAGMDDAVTKPFRMQDLTPMISRLALI